MKIKSVIFDLDGTLTAPVLDFIQIRKEMGLPLKAGDILTVFRPKTTTVGGEVLTVGEDRIGRIRLTSVGESASSAETVEGEGFKTGDIVRTGEG